MAAVPIQGMSLLNLENKTRQVSYLKKTHDSHICILNLAVESFFCCFVQQQPKIAHEQGAGSQCTKCGPKCPGMDLHFWR